jgi:hypothetical protein
VLEDRDSGAIVKLLFPLVEPTGASAFRAAASTSADRVTVEGD